MRARRGRRRRWPGPQRGGGPHEVAARGQARRHVALRNAHGHPNGHTYGLTHGLAHGVAHGLYGHLPVAALGLDMATHALGLSAAPELDHQRPPPPQPAEPRHRAPRYTSSAPRRCHRARLVALVVLGREMLTVTVRAFSVDGHQHAMDQRNRRHLSASPDGRPRSSTTSQPRASSNK